MSCWLGAKRWRNEEGDVVAKYPGTTSRIASEDGHPTKILRVPVTPTPPPEDIGIVLADLRAGRCVGFMPGGRIVHLQGCPISTNEHDRLLPQLRLPTRRYVVDLTYPRVMTRPAGPVHPVARVVQPEISARTVPLHPHLSYTRDGSDSWVCPISPHDTNWHWYPGATTDYLDQVAIWLLKTDVWLLTGGGILSTATWVGAAASHEPAVVLTYPPSMPCRCGSGVEYARCCRPRDFEALLQGIRRGSP